jgi:hypothetical protein
MRRREFIFINWDASLGKQRQSNVRICRDNERAAILAIVNAATVSVVCDNIVA